MEDSSSNISTSSSTIDVASNKSSEDPVNNSGKGLEQRFSSSIDSKPSSTSFSDTNVGGLPSNTSFQDSFSTGSSQEGASAFSGSQSMDTSLSGDQSSLDIGVFHTKRKLHGKDKKVCRVCGDKALGYNFNAMTCESCKAFFRRNALKQATPNCMFQGNCSVDIRTRRFCPHCRLKKCFNMGMKKEMILDEKQRRIRMEKVSRNRQKKYAKAQTKAQLKTAHLASCEGRSSKNTSKVLRSHSAKSLKPSPSPAAHHSSEQKSAEENSDSTDMNVKDSEKPSDISPRRTLTEAERNKLVSLESSFIAHFMNGETSNENVEEVQGLFNRAMLTVQKLVRFMKTVSEFRDLTVDDQTSCLKANLVACLTMIATGYYNVSQEGFLLQGIFISADMLRGLLQSHLDVVEKLLELSTVIQVECKPDFQLLAVLQCIMVFNPEPGELKHRLLLSNYQDNYLILLKHYLEERFSLREGKRLFIFLLQKLQDIKPMVFSFTEIANELGPDKVQPLVVEVFNIEKKAESSHR